MQASKNGSRKATLRMGAGAGYSGDRIEPAIELAAKGDLDYLVFECLAERTIALAQQAKLADPEQGYDPLLAERMSAVLKLRHQKGFRIITNMGAANPIAAAHRTAEVARSLGLSGLKIAAVMGDDVLDLLSRGKYQFLETGACVDGFRDQIVSANAYLGVDGLCQALQRGADVVITGRVADPALFLAPLVHEFGWRMDDWHRLGRGTLVGHLMECAGQVTGGYFADPGHKDVSGLARLGFPIAQVSCDGDVELTKVAGSGGQISVATCTEQLLYEIHDPERYIQPDVVADFAKVHMEQSGVDRVRITGGSGKARTDTLKVSVAYRDGYIGEGQMSYAGPGAVARARLAGEIVRERLTLLHGPIEDLRYELIGVDALHGVNLGKTSAQPYEARLRVAGRASDRCWAERIGQEVESLYTNGPAGGGGATRSVKEIVAVQSILLPRQQVAPQVHIVEA